MAATRLESPGWSTFWITLWYRTVYVVHSCFRICTKKTRPMTGGVRYQDPLGYAHARHVTGYPIQCVGENVTISAGSDRSAWHYRTRSTIIMRDSLIYGILLARNLLLPQPLPSPVDHWTPALLVADELPRYLLQRAEVVYGWRSHNYGIRWHNVVPRCLSISPLSGMLTRTLDPKRRPRTNITVHCMQHRRVCDIHSSLVATTTNK